MIAVFIAAFCLHKRKKKKTANHMSDTLCFDSAVTR